MIFYFSGTGNSKHAAIQTADALKETVIYMTEDEIQKDKVYTLRSDERVGFVFPVYWYGVPSIVVRFLQQLRLENYNAQYTYSIFTYGASCGNTFGQLKRILSEKQVELQAGFGIRMVDNYILAYDIAKEAERKAILKDAERELVIILEKVKSNARELYLKAGWQKPLSPALQFVYQHSNHSKHFYATNACIHCNKCMNECPTNSIHTIDQQIVWDKKCCGCLRCIHGCPSQAIQYGKRTIKRARYQFI